MKNGVSSAQKALNLWAIILIIWSIYRANFKLPQWFDEYIAKPVVFVLPVYYYILKYEKKDFFTAVGWKLKSNFSDVFLGLLLGGLFFLMAILANFIKFNKFVIFPTQKFFFPVFLLTILTAFATSISEEILSRGFVLKRLYEESKNIYTSSFFSSILFFFLHVPILFTNAKITGNLLLFFMTSDLVLSLANSFVFLEKKNLTLPILIHAFYNLSIYFFI